MSEKSYYNTNREKGEELETSKERALRQQNRILSFFLSFPDSSFSPEEVWKTIYFDETPITSIRRAITNLTDAGKLIKTQEMKVSSYGKKCHSWKAVIRKPIQQELFAEQVA